MIQRKSTPKTFPARELTGALTLGNGNGKSFGATINVLNNGVNNAVLLADNGSGSRNAITGTSLEEKSDAKILALTNKTLDILGDYGSLLGKSSVDGTGEINAAVFNAYAKKTGTINAIAVAGGVTGGGDGGFAFGGAVAVSDINNNSNAFLKDTTKFNANGAIDIDALEVKNSSSRHDYLLSHKVNMDATEYLANADKNKIDTINGGGNIVNVAFGGGGSTGEAGAGGLGISYAGLTNIMNVDIADNKA